MSTQDSPRSSIGPPSLIPIGLRSRRGSLGSVSASTPIDKEQLAQALDKIHSTASHSETLTTFNEFAPPPPPATTVESKGIVNDIMPNGLSGLYSRFKGAVTGGKEKTGPSSNKGDNDSIEVESTKSQNTTPTSKGSRAPTREDSGITASSQISASSSRLQSPTASSFIGNSSESQLHTMRSSKASVNSTAATTPGTAKSASSSRLPAIPVTKSTISTPTSATASSLSASNFNDGEFSRTDGEARALEEKTSSPVASHEHSVTFRFPDTRQSRRSNLDGSALQDSEASDDEAGDEAGKVATSKGVPSHAKIADDSLDQEKRGKVKSTSLALSSVRGVDSTRASTQDMKRPIAIERIAQSHLPGYQASRASSTDRSTAETSPINTSAHNSVRHGSFSVHDTPQSTQKSDGRISGTTSIGGEVVSTRLEQMRKQVLSKEFWMADENCKECFLCGDTFTAFRRKHHCRTCGSIFDSKCTSIISAQRFGVQGNLRVCKTCLDIITSRRDSSSDDSGDDESTLPTFFQSQQAKYELATRAALAEPFEHVQDGETVKDSDRNRSLTTPMMAIPAARRINDSANRRSAVLEIDAPPQLSRPSSSRSLKALSSSVRPPSSGHKRHHSKHNYLGRFRPNAEERAPFHRGLKDDLSKKSHLPAFHDDNIIDPDLAPYMSDEESSADEQLSIFATMNSSTVASPIFENDRSGFGSLLSASKKHRARAGEKSISGVSFTSRGMDDGLSPTVVGFARPNRRRNLSAASNTMHHGRAPPRQQPPGISKLDEKTSGAEAPSGPAGPLKMTRSASMRDARAPAIELNNASLHHVRKLLHQLLEDAAIPNIPSWEKALIPILLQCTDDVNPDVRAGDDIDIRHYVKLKKIPGGRPGDTAYVSGVVFTKNLALKSMPRSIANPRIVIVSFPIEYQRHQHHFMSLEPVIAQEKEFLRNMINRIASLRPQLLLVQKHISGLALQYLAEANIAVVYNVKQSVIEAVSRCAGTEIISSIDMVALKPVNVGKSAGFDVKTFVHDDIPGKKKTYIYLSGCPKELGCTIALRGASLEVLRKMKRITEFMVYVVYNLKLETCLMRDEFILIPSVDEMTGNMSPQQVQSLSANQHSTLNLTPTRSTLNAASDRLGTVNDDGQKTQISKDPTEQEESAASGPSSAVVASTPQSLDTKSQALDAAKIVSAHQSHSHGSQGDTLSQDMPMPTFYSDMVSKHQTKILSASPFVRFVQPYLLMRAREQEIRLVYLKRLRDQDTYEEQTESEKSKPQKFQLIKPEMVHERVTKAPRQIMEVLHAVHDAEYDKALHVYQTQKRQWENYIQGNLNLFDPYAHQNITVLYTVVCTATSIPCAGPDLLALAFYNEHAELEPDCTLGQYVEDLCLSTNTICTSNGCERKMSEHHRTYVHGEARITVFVEKSPCKLKGLQDSILMWSFCKVCHIETTIMPMSESTWKYSLGKYLELSFWSSELHLRADVCPHDIHRDHLRYFGFRNIAVRVHYDPIDLLEIIVPRTRVTWKVDNDLKLKNDLFTKIEERWNRFMASVHSRIKDLNTDSVAPEKAEACKAEIERLTKRAQDEHAAMIRKLQEKYMDSKYYEIIPLNRAVRAMQEKVVEWDEAFTSFDADFFPSEKDIRRLAALQIKKMFIDRDDAAAAISAEPAEPADLISDLDEKSPNASLELTRNNSNVSAEEAHNILTSVVEENQQASSPLLEGSGNLDIPLAPPDAAELDREGIDHLDLAYTNATEPPPPPPMQTPVETPTETPVPTDLSSMASPEESDLPSSPLEGSPVEATLSEKIDKLRRANMTSPEPGAFEVSGIPRPIERGTNRRSGKVASPPLVRTQSQPAGTIRRVHPGSRTQSRQGDHKTVGDILTPSVEGLKSSATEPVKAPDKKLAERFGLGSIKVHRKAGQSYIPRSTGPHAKKKDTKVSALAKHFEQLSREFEKERLRDKRSRAAKNTQSRVFPKASSKPIVEVYEDANEAVEERGPTDEQLQAIQPTQPDTEGISVVEGLADLNTESTAGDTAPHSPTDGGVTADETATEAETDDNHNNVSQTGSDDDGGASDADHSILDDIPGIAEIAESLRSSKMSSDTQEEIPKHEKTSLMKMLTNFWAERSASGWTSLEYPTVPGDHIWADMDVIVREDEPSSLIALALHTQDYKDKLADMRVQGQASSKDTQPTSSPSQDGPQDICEDGLNQAEVETSLHRATGTHLAYSFVDGTARMQCKIFFAEQFDAVRRKCGVADRIVESLSRCLKWDSKGGKTKSVFLKTLDDRLVIKSLSPIETQAFLKFAPAYFSIMAEALFHDLPTVIAKMLGFYQIIIKNPATGTEIKWDVLVMENLFYDRSPTRIFDLKGSMRNRKIQSTGEQNEVLLDENMVEFIYESPLFAREHSKKLLRAAIFNDTLFLQRNDVMDYSLMVAVDEARKELVVGIIDVVRTYTWDKKLESWIKDRGFAGGGRNRPTVTSPKEYKSRFREAMNRYILQAPNSWHQWQQYETRPDARIEARPDGGNNDNEK